MSYNIIKFDELDSTNTYAKKNILSLNDRDVIVCDLQTNGRGRMDRKFIATKDTLTFSVIYKDKFVIDNFKSLSLISAVSIYLTLKKYLDNITLKWPNDVYVNEKKISGILLESVSFNGDFSNIILGIGININNSSFLGEFARCPTSMFLETQKTFDKDIILNEILNNLECLIKDLSNNKMTYLDIFRKNNYLLNRRVYATINDEEKEIEVIDILDNNNILVKDDSKTYSLDFGEITFHKSK